MIKPPEKSYFAVVVWGLVVAIVLVMACAEMTGNGYMGGRTPTW